MDPEKGASESMENLIPSYAQQKAALAVTMSDCCNGQPPVKSQMYIPKVYVNTAYSKPSSRSPFQIAILVLLALSLATGFCMLYVRISTLQRQVYELESLITESSMREHTAKHGAPGSEDNVNPPAHSGSENEDNTDYTETEGQDKRSLERRSADEGDIHHPVRRTVRYGTTSIQHMSTHAVPLAGDPSRVLSSNWFRWTTSPASSLTNTVGQLPILQNTYIVAPHAGYYYIYSQVTCHNGFTGHPIGHAVWLVPHCGRSALGQYKKLMFTTLTQANTQLSSTDSNYLGGVFFLQKYDHIGIKPETAEGIARGTYARTQQSSYFGAFLLSATAPQAPTCSLNI